MLERADRVGGLASAWSIDTPDGPITWDRHYHVTLLSDASLRHVLAQLGLDAEMHWVETKTGYFTDGQLSSVSNSVEFLRLPGLPIDLEAAPRAHDPARLAVKDWQRLEQETVEEWLTALVGARRPSGGFWLPLLRAKLGESWPDANAAFIWATIQRLYAARRSGLKKEMFGYVPGGYAHVLDRFAAAPGRGPRRGDPMLVDRRAGASHGRGPGGAARGRRRRSTFDHVVVTSDTPTAERLCPGLTEVERARLRGIRYQGIVCASLVLRASLSEYYLTYLMDDLPFTAVVEMTALVDPASSAGTRSCSSPSTSVPDDPLFEVPDDEIERRLPRRAAEGVPGPRTCRCPRGEDLPGAPRVPDPDARLLGPGARR